MKEAVKMARWVLMAFICIALSQFVGAQQDLHNHDLGSAGGWSGDGGDEEVTQSARRGNTEGSGFEGFDPIDNDEEEALMPCLRQQKAADAAKPQGTFHLQCTNDGRYHPTQCDSKTGRCWCVDKDGKELLGTSRTSPERPKCAKTAEIIVPTRRPFLAIPEDLPENHFTDDIIIEDISTSRPFETEKISSRKTSKMLRTTAIVVLDTDYEIPDDSVNTQKPAFYPFFIQDPLVLAGIIGGAVLALLCIVLLVMFTIYRMRMKDKGSYALDEPKKSYGFAYTRARDQEFFA